MRCSVSQKAESGLAHVCAPAGGKLKIRSLQAVTVLIWQP
jgi:hypothetical protein